jgi:PLP dependent protein
MSIATNLKQVRATLPPHVTLAAVTKMQDIENLKALYNAGQRLFAENRVQDLLERYEQLPKDIEWHLIGHLQTNKVKYIAPFVKLIHSIDSLKLLEEVNKQALKNNRVIDCLLQLYIASEETKFGLSFEEAQELLSAPEVKELKNINLIGVMGMASNTTDIPQIKKEFDSLHEFYQLLKNSPAYTAFDFRILSMGMSSDYTIAIEAGSNLVRVGSLLFKTAH